MLIDNKSEVETYKQIVRFINVVSDHSDFNNAFSRLMQSYNSRLQTLTSGPESYVCASLEPSIGTRILYTRWINELIYSILPLVWYRSWTITKNKKNIRPKLR